MKKGITAGILFLVGSIDPIAAQSGIASIYSSHESSGKRVACAGHRLANHAMVAAHRSLPCGSRATITNHKNRPSVGVTIIDGGPFVRGRVLHLSPAAPR